VSAALFSRPCLSQASCNGHSAASVFADTIGDQVLTVLACHKEGPLLQCDWQCVTCCPTITASLSQPG
jgi:hypothetical protein